MSFGDCLAELMKTYGWKRSQFVRALANDGVDPSLVYRWLRTERTPKLHSGDRERIAACLNLCDADHERLRRAQVESLEGAKDPRQAGDSERAGQILVDSQRGQDLQPTAEPELRGRLRTQTPRPGPIWGRDEVLGAAIALLESAPLSPPPQYREVLTTYQGRGTLDGCAHHLASWLAALRGALQRGYDVVHLVTMDRAEGRSVRLVEHILRLCGTVGSYQPRFFSWYGALNYPCEMVLVPGTGAMVCLGTEHSTQVNAALLLKDPRDIEVLRAHFAALRTETRPLFHSYSKPEDGFRYLNTMLRTEEREGECSFCSGSLSSRTQPYTWFQHDSNWARNLPSWGVSDPDWMIALQKRRAEAFYRNVTDYRFREICSKSAVVRLAREGRGGPLGPHANVVVEDRLEQLENTIALLHTFDKYELVLLNAAEERDYITMNYLQIKHGIRGDDVVWLDGWTPVEDGADRRMGLEILEPTMCAAFRQYFLDLFEHRISPASSDKREVIQFLEAQLRWIRDSIQER
jgi:hypothetical protein